MNEKTYVTKTKTAKSWESAMMVVSTMEKDGWAVKDLIPIAEGVVMIFFRFETPKYGPAKNIKPDCPGFPKCTCDPPFVDDEYKIGGTD